MIWLLTSHVGAFVVQSFLHSLIAIIIIERALKIWGIRDPRTQFRYRLLTLALPLMMLPLYRLINPDRGSLLFRQESALFNVHRWLSLEPWDLFPLSIIFLAMLVITSLVFFIQEIFPIIRDTAAKVREGIPRSSPPPARLVEIAARLGSRLNLPRTPLSVVTDDTPFIFASGARSHSIIMSTGLLTAFTEEQLESALAHELAHVARRSNAMTWLIFLVRVVMFFNPIVLIVFRRIVQDDEHICDDITASLTGKPMVLAEILRVFYRSYTEYKPSVSGGIAAMHEGMTNYSHSLLLRERIARLEAGITPGEERFSIPKFLVTAGSIAVCNYFVV